jgi:polyhydroxybutyrate depolymerase
MACSGGGVGGAAAATADAATSRGADAAALVDAAATDAAATDTGQAAADTATGGPSGQDASPRGGADVDAAAVPRTPAPETIGPADRPAQVVAPAAWTPAKPWPMVLVLHGYGATGPLQAAYLGVQARVDQLGFVAVIPDGTLDNTGKQFWNANGTCCDFTGQGVDDLAYLTGLIDEAIAKLQVDPQRVYVLGHSNGGFMGIALACHRADKVVAVASLAGAASVQPEDCKPSQPVSVLQIHGSLDAVILYGGGQIFGKPYAGAEDTVGLWRQRNDCPALATDLGDADYEGFVLGKETVRKQWAPCKAGTTVGLWTIQGGSHIPGLTETFKNDVLAHLLAQQRKPAQP